MRKQWLIITAEITCRTNGSNLDLNFFHRKWRFDIKLVSRKPPWRQSEFVSANFEASSNYKIYYFPWHWKYCIMSNSSPNSLTISSIFHSTLIIHSIRRIQSSQSTPKVSVVSKIHSLSMYPSHSVVSIEKTKFHYGIFSVPIALCSNKMYIILYILHNKVHFSTVPHNTVQYLIVHYAELTLY